MTVRNLCLMMTFIASWTVVPRAAGTADEAFFEIHAKKFSFTPNVITVNRGDTVRIRLLSEDVVHGIYIDGYDVHTSAYPGNDGSIRFVADKPGRFIFRCSITCGEFHPYMVGHLRVTPNTPYYVILATVLVAALFAVGFALSRRREEDSVNG